MGKYCNLPGLERVTGGLTSIVGKSSGAISSGFSTGVTHASAFGRTAGRVGMNVGKIGLGAGIVGGAGYVGYQGYERGMFRGRSSGANGPQGRSSGGMM